LLSVLKVFLSLKRMPFWWVISQFQSLFFTSVVATSIGDAIDSNADASALWHVSTGEESRKCGNGERTRPAVTVLSLCSTGGSIWKMSHSSAAERKSRSRRRRSSPIPPRTVANDSVFAPTPDQTELTSALLQVANWLAS